MVKILKRGRTAMAAFPELQVDKRAHRNGRFLLVRWKTAEEVCKKVLKNFPIKIIK